MRLQRTKNLSKRYFIELAYEGAPFAGWQIQPNANSVQAELQKAMSIFLKHEVKILGAGRTDTGVHAKQMFAHFDTHVDFHPERFLTAMNGILPSSIALYDVFPVKEDSSARFEATSRTYEYLISTRKNPFHQGRAFEYRGLLDFEKMNEAAEILLKYEDFACFCKAGAQNKTNLCKISEAYWEQDHELWRFTITANRFLRNMVRAIVGTLIEIGKSELPASYMHEVIQSGDRNEAGFSVPAHGLYLTNIAYPEEIKK